MWKIQHIFKNKTQKNQKEAKEVDPPVTSLPRKPKEVHKKLGVIEQHTCYSIAGEAEAGRSCDSMANQANLGAPGSRKWHCLKIQGGHS